MFHFPVAPCIGGLGVQGGNKKIGTLRNAFPAWISDFGWSHSKPAGGFQPLWKEGLSVSSSKLFSWSSGPSV